MPQVRPTVAAIAALTLSVVALCVLLTDWGAVWAVVPVIEELRQRGVNFRSLTDSIDTSTPMGRFFFHVMGAGYFFQRVERGRAHH